MSKELLKAIFNETNKAYTENAAAARRTTGSELLNFFSVGGALRSRTPDEIINIFDKAFGENPKYALKALFYFRDIRGGQGERNTFRVIIKDLAQKTSVSQWLGNNLDLVPEYGRWDDLFALENTDLEVEMIEYVKKALLEDVRSMLGGKNPSILAKWMPSENASSAETKRLAYKFIKALHTTPRAYRKTLSKLREKIGVLERKLSANEWGNIDYSHVPSQANILYRKAFQRHDQERYTEFLNLVKKGEVKINASVLYPYEIVRKVHEVVKPRWYRAGEDRDTTKTEEEALDALWRALPNYFETPENSLVVADTSGSMFMAGIPIDVCVSLAIYAAERNTGIYHNRFITFSREPVLQEIAGSTIVQKVKNLDSAAWACNTNVEAVFGLILNAAKKNKISNDEMVKKVYIISDMEFDSATYGDDDETLFNNIRKRYEKEGYTMPLLVFWNVSARNNQFPMSIDDRGFLNVSGCSPSIFTGLLKSEFKDAYGFMIDILDNERYSKVNYNI